LANLTGNEHSRYVQEMFGRIARHYDLMNRVMTGGQDVHWRRIVMHRAALPPGAWLLDLGAGTGDLAREALRQFPEAHVMAADFTLQMMQVGRARNGVSQGQPGWTAADAYMLPFPGEAFDAVVSGFLLRNLGDLAQSLREQYRVLKPGGRLVALDTSPPPHSLLSPAMRFYLHQVIPALGRIIAGQAEAYRYLPDSTESFLEPERLAKRLGEVGFRETGFQRLMFGAVAIHWGVKPGRQTLTGGARG
jgi:demethylmenaquinone methyltransferase/2-methoxy-6-polyprenyl-1,4-benzoquinol methylase